jgi:hypothetical protein
VSVDEDERTFRIQSRGGDTTYLETRYDGTSELVLRSLTAEPDQLLIYPSGLAAGGMVLVMETTPGNRRQVSANRAGQVRITQP